jgi:anaerobic ribonucleoside-triphosphate reductase
MLELALEAVEMAETDDFTHAMQAHKKWEKAEEMERALEKAAHEVHVEAVDADGILDAYKSFQFKEDREMRREMAVSDIAHRVETYVESRLAQVRAVEEAAKKEEDEAEAHLAELFVNEDEIRGTLAELKALRNSKPKA